MHFAHRLAFIFSIEQKKTSQYHLWTLLCALLIGFMLLSPMTAQSKLYKWIDDNGKVHYSDKLIVEAIHHERSTIGKDGIESHKIKRARNREELVHEAELERERKKLLLEQKELLKKQEAKDQVLLRTFQTEDDILIAKRGKLKAINVRIKVDRSNIRQAKRQLAILQKNAATSELQGQRAAKSLLDDIEDLRNRLKANYSSIIKREQKKARIKKSSFNDLSRFRELKNLEAGKPMLERAEDPDNSSLLDTVVLCENIPLCDALWMEAEAYVRQHSTTRIQMLSDTIIITRSAVKSSDLSITVSMLRRDKEGETFLFFDMQCTENLAGEAFCNSEKTQKIRTDFKITMLKKIPEIKARLAIEK